ncbi:hypothetical protein ACJ41O_010281 [Fusarium nematophilum]
MRLISAKRFIKDGKIRFKEFYRDTPPYAILSHTWEDGQEVTHDNCKSASPLKDKKGYEKIRNTCRLAIREDIEYVWIDTCCIDKSSSAELTEAINSMFQWYQQAKICYVYLSDLNDASKLGNCRWFRRGWTLQELIAPKAIKFYNRSWDIIGDKESLLTQLSVVTNIDAAILSHQVPLSSACVAKRFSWAANRRTTRAEDVAYCLLGIFDINMPMLYGEGYKAFIRLQEEIIRSTHDLSIFGWTLCDEPAVNRRHYSGFLATSPHDFASCSSMQTRDPLQHEGEMSITNKGVQLKGSQYVSHYKNGAVRYSLSLKCSSSDHPDEAFLVPMRKTGPNIFARATSAGCLRTSSLGIVSSYEVKSRSFILLTKLPSSLSPQPSKRNKDTVSALRDAVVDIKLPSEAMRLGINGLPQKCWDAEDFLFFSSDNTVPNWGCVMLPDKARFVCFWHKELGEWSFRGTLFDASGDAMDGLMRELYVFAEALDYPASLIDVLLARYGIKMNQQYVEVGGPGRRRRVSFEVLREDDPQVCCGPRFKVQISRLAI